MLHHQFVHSSGLLYGLGRDSEKSQKIKQIFQMHVVKKGNLLDSADKQFIG